MNLDELIIPIQNMIQGNMKKSGEKPNRRPGEKSDEKPGKRTSCC